MARRLKKFREDTFTARKLLTLTVTRLLLGQIVHFHD